jgi:Fic family protein
LSKKLAFFDTLCKHVDRIDTISGHVERIRKHRRMAFIPNRPYNQLPPLPPRGDLETRRVLKATIDARAALARLHSSGQLIPSQDILIGSIPLLEAQASSEIENIVTTADRLFRFANEAATQADPATKEALRYRAALYEGFQLLSKRPVSTNMAVEICSRIKGVATNIRSTPGTALLNESSCGIVYTPPQGSERLRTMLANWERYIHEEKGVDPLVRMAVMHYQFEAIHPFTDGNGRTGRILNLLFLIEQRLLDLPVLYLSRYIIAHKREYYALLLKVTADQAWEEWILFMLTAINETSQWTNSRIQAIRKLLDETADKVRSQAPKIYTRELVELIFTQPYTRISDLVTKGIAQRQTASTHLKKLADIGLLEERPAGREKLFINTALVRLLS